MLTVIHIREKVDENSRKNRVEARVRVEQRMSDPATGDSYEPAFSLLAAAFGINLKDNYILSFNCQQSLKVVLAYLDRYALYSSKRINWLDQRGNNTT